jgi:hypothetical protein
VIVVIDSSISFREEKYIMVFQSEDFTVALRNYQIDAINSIVEAFKRGKRNYFLSMATGTGKSMVYMGAAKYFLENNIVEKVIFIYDRLEMSKQMYHRLVQFFSANNVSELSANKMMYSNIIVATSQKLLRAGEYKNVVHKKEKFLVIFDDITHGIPKQIHELVDYLDCYILAITSVSEKSNGDSEKSNQTRKVTNLFDSDEPLYKYSLEDALLDGNIYSHLESDGEDSFGNIVQDLASLLDKYPQNTHFIYEIKKILMRLRKEYYYLEDVKDFFDIYLKSDLSKEDIRSLAYKKDQLKVFEKLLSDDQFFEEKKKECYTTEAVWQKFFESNQWIFGYSLNCIFTTSLDEKKLEQVISGYSFNNRGKRVDALMKTRGMISSLCFVELKHHETMLLANQYRGGCWSISSDLAGGISQIQRYVQLSIKKIESKIEITTDEGAPTGEIVFNFNPRSYLIIGSLKEFKTDNGINEDKLSSFEMFRSSIKGPEIITFDELYERAKYTLENSL